MPTLQALRDFSGPDGKHRTGDRFEVPASRAEFLVAGGYAEPAERVEEVQPAALVKPVKAGRRK